ncbi:MAG: DNA topoisomerase (ATP-hydrolyzing) subunit A [Alphaproteobacteria bacterium]
MPQNQSDNPLTEIIPIAIEDEMKKSYLDYAMSVIVSRALPDVRDGLKPVHRRILYAMYISGCDYNKPFRKSARIVGDVMGKYHPHGDSAIYDALVRMAQVFSLRITLVDGQGNFGSMDGDSPAAMRYTESRLAKIAHSLLEDIDRNTVDFHENYDGSEIEPDVLPSRFPNILINGAGGIAVGMATNIPPHNLGEVIEACCMYIDNNDVSFEELATIVQGPDFPTGGIILGKTGILSAIKTGRGSIIIRGKAEIEQLRENRQAIIITEIPYQVNKARMVEKIAELVREKRIEGISDLRDESDKSGIRVVVELKRDAVADVVLNQLYIYTPLQVSFGINTLALDNGRPKVMNLRDVISAFISFREMVITRRTIFLLNKAKDRAHILVGLLIATSNIDEIIILIKTSPDPTIAKERLMERKWPSKEVKDFIHLIEGTEFETDSDEYYLTEIQAKAILDMRLHRLTGLEHSKLTEELSNLAIEIKEYLEILSSRSKLMQLLKDELIAIKDEFSTPRRTQIEINEWEHDIEDLIQKEDMVVTVTSGGYIKRSALSTYKSQKRGGKGRSGIKMREEDITTEVFVANTHAPVLFFSNIGKVYKLKVYKLPIGTMQSKGKALVNIFPLAEGEFINNVMPLPEDENLWVGLNIMFATAKGGIRRNDLSDFHSIQSNGKIAIRLDNDDKLIGVKVCKETDHVLLASRDGKCVRFPVTAIRVFKSRTSDGVRGMNLSENDKVISMTILHGTEIDSLTKENYLKISIEVRRSVAKCETLEEALELMNLIETEIEKEQIYKLAREEEFILTVTENGFGKRSSAYDYRVTNRGGKGIINIITSERNGHVIGSFPVNDTDDIMLMSDKGTIIRCPVKDIRAAGRNTQGVMLFRTAKDEVVVSIARIDEPEGEEMSEDSDIEDNGIAEDNGTIDDNISDSE